jgi:hypothetical protein
MFCITLNGETVILLKWHFRPFKEKEEKKLPDLHVVVLHTRLHRKNYKSENENKTNLRSRRRLSEFGWEGGFIA